MGNSFGKMIMIAGAVMLGFLLLAFIFSGSFTGNVPSAGSFLPTSNIPRGTYSNTGGGGSTGTGGTAGEVSVTTDPASYRVSVSLDNARSEIQPAREHITIRNGGSLAVNITGWALKNGKGERPINVVEDTLAYEVPDVVVIPQGIEFLDPDKKHFQGDIILMPGESAILITGKPFAQYRFPLPLSFKENICTGYLATIDDYPFSPSLTKSCPRLRDEEAAKYITQTCYDYIKGIQRCDDPEETRPTRFETLENSCQNFIEKYANYESCVALHGDNENFYSPKKWRVFLGRSFEMWARSNEKVRLYDKAGNLVAEKSY